MRTITIEIEDMAGGMLQGQIREYPAVISVAANLPTLLEQLGDALRECWLAGVRV